MSFLSRLVDQAGYSLTDRRRLRDATKTVGEERGSVYQSEVKGKRNSPFTPLRTPSVS
jgi:hypothetical protein